MCSILSKIKRNTIKYFYCFFRRHDNVLIILKQNRCFKFNQLILRIVYTKKPLIAAKFFINGAVYRNI